MAVIREGIEAAHVVDYETPEFIAIDELPPALTLHTITTSSDMCGSSSGASALFDPAYYEDLIARPFREGTIGEAPVLPGIGLFMPAGTSAGKDKGLFRRTVPEFHADLCTGCMECALVCPDAAIPNTVHEIHDLLLTAIKDLDVTEPQREALRGLVYPVAEKVRESYRADKSDRAFTDVVAAAVATLDVDQPSLRRTLDQMVASPRDLPGRPDAPVLRRDGEDHPRHRRAVLRDHRPVEVHRLPGVHRGVRPERPDPAGPGRRRAEHPAGALRVLHRPARDPEALLRGRDRRGRRAQAPHARAPQLLLHRRRSRRLPRVRRGHRDPAGDGHQPCRRRRAPPDAPAPARGPLDAAGGQARIARPLRDRAPGPDRVDHRHAGQAPLPLRGRAHRQRPGADRHRQRDRLQQRLRLHDAVQLLPRPVGQQPVPGLLAAGQGHLRGHQRPDRARRARHAPGRDGARRRLRPGRPRAGAADALVGAVHPRGAEPAAHGHDDRR